MVLWWDSLFNLINIEEVMCGLHISGHVDNECITG